MGTLPLDIQENEFLRECYEEATAKALQKALLWQLQAKFGLIPAWAESRITAADDEEMERWFHQLLVAESIEAALAE